MKTQQPISKIGTYKLEYIDISNEKFDIANLKCKVRNVKRLYTRMMKKHHVTATTGKADPTNTDCSITFVVEGSLITFGTPMVGLDSEWSTYLDDVMVDIPVIIYK